MSELKHDTTQQDPAKQSQHQGQGYTPPKAAFSGACSPPVLYMSAGKYDVSDHPIDPEHTGCFLASLTSLKRSTQEEQMAECFTVGSCLVVLPSVSSTTVFKVKLQGT